MASLTPAPIEFAPSQEFDGSDGKWSSFVVRVGTPGQSFRVLPAAAMGETMIPLPDGCIKAIRLTVAHYVAHTLSMATLRTVSM